MRSTDAALRKKGLKTTQLFDTVSKYCAAVYETTGVFGLNLSTSAISTRGGHSGDFVVRKLRGLSLGSSPTAIRGVNGPIRRALGSRYAAPIKTPDRLPSWRMIAGAFQGLSLP